MIQRRWDPDSGIIHVSGSGLWTFAEVDAHYAALRRLIDEARHARRPVRVISDITRAQRQLPETEARIREQIDRTFRPGDRIAFIVTDADDKQYVRQKLGDAEMAVFSSLLAAEMWLFRDAAD